MYYSIIYIRTKKIKRWKFRLFSRICDKKNKIKEFYFMKALLIAEKPDLMRKVKAVYEKNGHPDTIHFKSFVGHIMTLAQPQDYDASWEKWNLADLPIFPDKFQYKPTKNKMDIYKDLKETIRKGNYDYIINCCDPGREGQHIFFSFYDTIGCQLPVKRMWHRDLTEKEIDRALKELRDETELSLQNMTKASKLRAYFDWLIGMNFTRTYSLLSNKKSNLGRVMTPTLKIIVDRELEIQRFKPTPYWEIEADFTSYKGIYINMDEEQKTMIKKKETAEEIIKQLQTKGIVREVWKKQDIKYAPELYSLSTLQNEANKTYGYTMKETLAIAQELYQKRFISYPRTDSAHVTTAIGKEFKNLLKPLATIKPYTSYIQKIVNDTSLLEKVSKNKKYVNDKKVSDHYAVIPTEVVPNVDNLSESERNVYLLIIKRFISIFLPPMVSDKTTIFTENNGHLFQTNGSVLQSLGYMELYPYQANDTMLPNVKKGDEVLFRQAELIEKQTKAPTRFTDQTLNIAMEHAGRFVEEEELKQVLKETKGIGTPATRGNIVEKLVDLKMMERRKKSFYATEYGISIITSLGDHSISSPELTAEWEDKLKKMENNQYQVNVFYQEMLSYIKEGINQLKSSPIKRQTSSSTKKEIGICPSCGGKVIEGKNYYMCESYKNTCEFILPKEINGTKIPLREIKKIIEKKETKVFSFTWKSGKKGEAKLRLNAENKVEFVFPERQSNEKATNNVVGVCPHCGSKVKSGKNYYLCENYRNPCNFLIKKEIKGATISETNIKKLLKGEVIGPLTFEWKEGKKGEAKIKYENHKLSFIFE